MQNKTLNLISSLSIPSETIERRIYVIRGQKVMLDSDLAELYYVTTGNLNLAVSRNKSRFPADFMFQLTKAEAASLLLQFVIAKNRRGGRQTAPYVFTEQGVAMLSSVLNSERAIQVNIAIMGAFVKLREIMSTHKDLARKIEQLEKKQQRQGLDISVIFKVIKRLIKEPEKSKTKIGFRT